MKRDELTQAILAVADALSQAMATLLDQLDDEHLQALADLFAQGARPGLRFVARTGSQPPEVTFLLVDSAGRDVPFGEVRAVRGVQ